nr:ATP-binding cassette domain-containing protein [Propionibacterium sp.]
MSELAVSVQGLGKTYRIRSAGPGPTRATEAIVQAVRHPLRRPVYEEFQALKDISFEIPFGEAVGIIGRNGAGKSTLLKILTRITAPTAGRIELAGRVGSLLEVGTGFHPELTGRENIYLNGTLLGMRRREIKRRFDEIVEFAGVHRFLDTPVKRYSSGMYVRLAFSVAAHLETEILAIDEVLAVGDAEFKRRSLEKMRSVAQDGRTVLYVSHQMSTVKALCTSALYLDAGRLAYQGPVQGGLDLYRNSFEQAAETARQAARRPGTGELRTAEVTAESGSFEVAQDKVIHLRIPASDRLTGPYFVSCHVRDRNGIDVTKCDSRLVEGWFDPARETRLKLSISGLWLPPGRYSIDVYLCQMGILDAWEAATTFEVLPELPYAETLNDEAIVGALVLCDFGYEEEAT